MSKQRQLAKLIKHLPAWISGAISLVTAVISFVLLIQGHYKLGITVLGGFLVLAFLILFIYLAFSKKQPTIKRGKKGKQAYRFEKYRIWALIGIAIEIIIIFAIIYFKKSRAFVIEGFSGTTKDIQLVDVSVVDEHVTSALDIKMRNIGAKVAVIKLARIHIQDFQDFEFDGCDFSIGGTNTGGLIYTAEYDFDISKLDKGQNGDISLSQVIFPNEADRFKITLYPKINGGLWLLYKIKLELIYNENNQSVISDPIIFISSFRESTQSAEKLYGLGLSDSDILDKFSYLLEDPNYHLFYDSSSKGEFLQPEKALEIVHDCYKSNLDMMTRFFSDSPIILSEQAEVEYKEWQRVFADLP